MRTWFFFFSWMIFFLSLSSVFCSLCMSEYVLIEKPHGDILLQYNWLEHIPSWSHCAKAVQWFIQHRWIKMPHNQPFSSQLRKHHIERGSIPSWLLPATKRFSQNSRDKMHSHVWWIRLTIDHLSWWHLLTREADVRFVNAKDINCCLILMFSTEKSKFYSDEIFNSSYFISFFFHLNSLQNVCVCDRSETHLKCKVISSGESLPKFVHFVPCICVCSRCNKNYSTSFTA